MHYVLGVDNYELYQGPQNVESSRPAVAVML